MHPVSGQVELKVKEFVAREGEKPAPQTNTKAQWPYTYFGVLFEVVEPKKYAGMTIYSQVRYFFGPATIEIGGVMREVAAVQVTKSRHSQFLDNFMLATKANTVPIPWSDNVLPKLEKIVLRNDTTFAAILKDGWIDTIIPPDINEDVADDWADEPEETPVPETEEESSDDTDDWGEPDEDDFADGADFDETDDELDALEGEAPWDEVED